MVFASPASLADIMNENWNDLSVGPLNNNSRFGFITSPENLDLKLVPVAASAAANEIAF